MPKTVVYGRHPVKELLRAGRRKIFSIFYIPQSSNRLQDILDDAKKKSIPLKTSNAKQLGNRAAGANHQGILAEVEPVKLLDEDLFVIGVKEKSRSPVIVVLDSIQDPHNFGAILRSALTFGIAGAIFPKNRSCEINSTVVKTSAGATEHMDFCRVTNIAETLRFLRKEGFSTVAAEADGEKLLSDFVPAFPLALVIGAEGKGVRPLVRKNCDITVRIPLLGKMESLNASNAAAIFFYEISKHL